MVRSIPPRVEHIVMETIETRTVSGMVVGVADADQPIEHVIAGTDAVGHPLTHDTLFPVASTTKLAVALAILRLQDMGALHVQDQIARYVPEAVVASSGITLRSLLAHTSGVPESYPQEADIYGLDLTWSRIAQACLETPLVETPHTKVRYSDVGYSLLAVIVERVTGQPFPAALQTLVCAPLGLEAYLGVVPPRRPAVIDVGDSLFAGTPLEFYNSPFFQVLGEPASGLVTTVVGALCLVRAYHDSAATLLTMETQAAARSDQTDHLGGGIPGWFDLITAAGGWGQDCGGHFHRSCPLQLVPVHSVILGHLAASCGAIRQRTLRGQFAERRSLIRGGVLTVFLKLERRC